MEKKTKPKTFDTSRLSEKEKKVFWKLKAKATVPEYRNKLARERTQKLKLVKKVSNSPKVDNK